MKAHNIYIDFLKELQVPYTSEWSTERFDSMSFKSLFGMQQLLKEYGVPSEGFSQVEVFLIACAFHSGYKVGPRHSDCD